MANWQLSSQLDIPYEESKGSACGHAGTKAEKGQGVEGIGGLRKTPNLCKKKKILR